MIIIIEGPRGSGKTSFVLAAEAVCYVLVPQYEVIKYKAERGEDPFADMKAEFITQGLDQSSIYIWDRALVTEYVMSNYLKRQPHKVLYDHTKELFDILDSAGAITIQLDPTPEELTKRLAIRNDGRPYDMGSIEESLAEWRNAHRAFRYDNYFLAGTLRGAVSLLTRHINANWAWRRPR